ncbi:MAG: dehydrogenase [Roseibacillus sp.]|nr:dehydrogenase [Roseibacillus sp.]
MRRHPWLRAILILIAASSVHSAEPVPADDPGVPFQLGDGDTVVFVGSEFTEQRIKHNHLEAALTARWPDRGLRFYNLGWSGDTPAADSRGYFGGAAEGYRRLMDELNRIKPSVVFLEYGAIAAYDGPDGVQPFLARFDKLVTHVRRHTGRVVIVTPTPVETKPRIRDAIATLQSNRSAVTKALIGYADDHGLRAIDLFRAGFPGSRRTGYTHDGIRLNEEAYAAMADRTLAELKIDAPRLPLEKAAKLRDLIAWKNDLYFHRYRPQNETYLRGFRKHEQGKNAKEIPLFDAMIAQAEARIAAFAQNKPLVPAPEAIPPAPRTVDALDPEDERRELKVPEGFEISLFAAEPMVKNPIHMNWDARGRLWVATSPIYPQIMPGARPSDEIIVLEDTDGDGRADKRTVFADDLLIPTAVLPDDRGGAYVANSTEVLHLSDTDGDGRADTRRVVLAGFGTEDTHHILHTFMWGPDGALYFNQSIYIHTHTETPHGVERLMGSGIWRLQTDTHKAEIVSRGLVNPWGHGFNRWGQSFATDGAGGHGINYAFRGSAFATANGYRRVLPGLNPGRPKYCGLVVISGRGFPDDWQDTLVANDFRGNRTHRFALEQQDSGYISKQQPDVITSRHRAFRPVDLKMGPDGALYVADWYNPIINHGEVDFRDPRRDTQHGRIWRLIRTDAPGIKRVDFVGASIAQLVTMLGSSEQYTRNTARRQLVLRDATKVAQALRKRLTSLKPTSASFEHDRLEILWTFQAIGVVELPLWDAVASSPDHRARATAMRILDDWGPPSDGGIERLRRGVADEHPQVRLEAVNTARYFDSDEAASIALGALDRNMDPYLDFALWETMRRLENRWLPKFLAGKQTFGGDPKQVAFAIKAVEKPQALNPLVELLAARKLDAKATRDAIALVGEMGTPGHLTVLYERALTDSAVRVPALAALVTASSRAKPGADLSRVSEMLDQPQAAHLAGIWRVEATKPKLIALAKAPGTDEHLRWGALVGLAAFGDRTTLSEIAGSARPVGQRRQAIQALVPLDPKAAAAPAAKLLSDPAAELETETIVNAFLSQKSGPSALTAALKGKSLPPGVATFGLRCATTAGKRGADLVSIFSASASPVKMPQQLTTRQIGQLRKDVIATGDPARGEAIYRRPALACMACHAIAGGGGKVGPDMVSLGASSPVDYIIDSLLSPSAKIKEGYHTVAVTTKDNTAISGTLVREGGGSIVVRDGTGKETEIADAQVQSKTIVPVSLMPPALTASLNRSEFVDLVAYLSSLGRDGAYKAPSNAFVRRWEIGDKVTFSRVDGSLPPGEIKGRTLRYTIEVTTPGSIAMLLDDSTSVIVKRAGDEGIVRGELYKILGARMVLDLPKGLHSFDIHVTPRQQVPLRIEVVEVPGSTGRATPVNE